MPPRHRTSGSGRKELILGQRLVTRAHCPNHLGSAEVKLSGVLRRLGVLRGHRLGPVYIARPKRLHEAWEEEVLSQALSVLSIDCVFDVGANEGQFTDVLRNRVGFSGTIVSFEPMPDAAARLRRLAAGDPLWFVEELAIADVDGTADFHVMAHKEFSSLRRPSTEEVSSLPELTRFNTVERTLTVETQTLSTALARVQLAHAFQRPMLKLDTQGSDYLILAASPAAARSFVAIQSELAIKRIYDGGQGYRASLDQFDDLGFELSAFIPNNSGHFPHLIEVNCLMVRADQIGVRPDH